MFLCGAAGGSSLPKVIVRPCQRPSKVSSYKSQVYGTRILRAEHGLRMAHRMIQLWAVHAWYIQLVIAGSEPNMKIPVRLRLAESLVLIRNCFSFYPASLLRTSLKDNVPPLHQWLSLIRETMLRSLWTARFNLFKEMGEFWRF